MKSARKVVVVGSSNTDMSIKMDRLPRPGETILGGKFATAPGGKGANQAVGAARAGANVTFIGRVGADAFGDQAAAGLAADGINTNFLTRDKDEPSGVALIFIGNAGENSIAVAPGANAKLSPADLKKARKAFTGAAIVLLQLETPLKTVEAAAEMAAAAGARVILNPAPAQPLPDSLLRRVSVLTPNESEAELLTGIKLSDRAAVERAAANLLQRGVENVVITLGSAGAYVSGLDGHQWVPGYEVEAVDTTAAGDVFNGALASALAGGKSLAESALFANAAAAISVTRRGAQPSAPQLKEIEGMMAFGKTGKSSAAPKSAPQRNGHHGPNSWKRTARIQA